MSITLGTKGYTEEIVKEAQTAKAARSGLLPVYGTPFMISIMELAAWSSVQNMLEPGKGTVGTRLEVSHLSPSPVGIKVWAETEVIAVEGRKITFSVKAYDEEGLIGEGIHERVIIDEKRFTEKCQAKVKK